MPFSRGAGFDWSALVSNLARGGAVLVAPLLGSGAELKVLKFTGELPPDLRERDFQFGGIAADDAGVTPKTMKRWTPEQRGRFLGGGAELLSQRQEGALSPEGYEAGLARLLNEVEATGPRRPDPEEVGQAGAVPEQDEPVRTGPPSPRVRQLMRQNPGMSREEAERIAGNEAVFADGTGRDAARVEAGGGDEAAASELRAQFEEWLAGLGEPLPDDNEGWSRLLEGRDDVTKIRDRIHRSDDLLIRNDRYTPTHLDALERFDALGVGARVAGTHLTEDGDEQVGIVATQYVPGANLEIRMLAAELGPEEIDRDAWAGAVTRTMATVHNDGWLHGDLKGDQILGEPDDMKLIDLESAQPLATDTAEGVAEFGNELGRMVELLLELREDDEDQVREDVSSYVSGLEPELRDTASRLVEDFDELLSDLE